MGERGWKILKNLMAGVGVSAEHLLGTQEYLLFVLELVVFPLLVFVTDSFCISCSWYVWHPKHDSVLL